MSEKNAGKEQKAEKEQTVAPAPSKKWGIDGDRMLAKFRAVPVRVQLANGGVLRGVLVGYEPYTLTIRADGRVVLVNKGAVATVEIDVENV